MLIITVSAKFCHAADSGLWYKVQTGPHHNNTLIMACQVLYCSYEHVEALLQCDTITVSQKRLVQYQWSPVVADHS